MSAVGSYGVPSGISPGYALAPAPRTISSVVASAANPATSTANTTNVGAPTAASTSWVDVVRNINTNPAAISAAVDAGSVTPLGATPAPAPTAAATDAAAGAAGTSTTIKEHRSLFEGLSNGSPFDLIPNFFTNLVGNITGNYDDRYGQAGAHILQAGERIINSGLRHVAQGEGVIATGSGLLSKVIPIINFAMGSFQVWKGWNELKDHTGGPMALLHSKTARGGLLGLAAGATLFIPGVGGAIAGAALLATMAANDLDAFHGIDWETQDAESNPAYAKFANATGHLLTKDKKKPGDESIFQKIKHIFTGEDEKAAATATAAAASAPTNPSI